MTDPIAAQEQDNFNATIKSRIETLADRIEIIRHSTDQFVLDLNRRIERVEQRTSGATRDEARKAAELLISTIGLLEFSSTIDISIGKKMRAAVATLAAGAGL